MRSEVESRYREARAHVSSPPPPPRAGSRPGHSGSAAAARRLSYSASSWPRRQPTQPGRCTARRRQAGASSRARRSPRAVSLLCGSAAAARGVPVLEVPPTAPSSTDNGLVAQEHASPSIRQAQAENPPVFPCIYLLDRFLLSRWSPQCPRMCCAGVTRSGEPSG